ncbi:MAG: YitT family protein, partial [Faecousia sp.]
MKQTKSELLRNILMIFFGSTLFALGFDLFLEPSGINCGGVSGIAMLVVYATQSKWLTVGILSAMINIPLFFFGYRQIGKYFFFGSMFGMLISSVGFDLFAKLLPVVPMDPLVAAIFGGVSVGAGLGVVFLAGASTGGTDIVARLLKLKFRNFPIGKIMLSMDLIIAAATGIVYRQFTNTLYSVVTL